MELRPLDGQLTEEEKQKNKEAKDREERLRLMFEAEKECLEEWKKTHAYKIVEKYLQEEIAALRDEFQAFNNRDVEQFYLLPEDEQRKVVRKISKRQAVLVSALRVIESVFARL